MRSKRSEAGLQSVTHQIVLSEHASPDGKHNLRSIRYVQVLGQTLSSSALLQTRDIRLSHLLWVQGVSLRPILAQGAKCARRSSF